MSRSKLMVALAAAAFAALMAGTPASASSTAQSPLGLLSSQGQIEVPSLQTVRWRGYCRNWAWTCADRWGRYSPRFYRCMRRHDC